MAAGLPDLTPYCIPLGAGPGSLCVTFPGGVTLCAQDGFDTGDANKITRSLIGQINSALMPLAPFFMTLDVVKAIMDCITAIPECIAELSPKPILDCLPELGKKVEKLLALIPQLSVPVLIKGILDVVVVQLIGLRQDIGALINQQGRIAAAAVRAQELGNVELQAMVDCANANLETQFQNHNAAMTPLNRLVGVVNALLELAGLQGLELLPEFADHLDAGVLDVIDKTISTIQVFAAALPG